MARDVIRKYWRELDQLKVYSYYVDSYYGETVKIDNNLNIFLAITSSASIAAWAIWQNFEFIWGLLIAISQIITAIRVLLPYSKRLAILPGLKSDLNMLFLKMENDWYPISKGFFSEPEIHEAHMEIKERLATILDKYENNHHMPFDEKLMVSAEKDAKKFFANHY